MRLTVKFNRTTLNYLQHDTGFFTNLMTFPGTGIVRFLSDAVFTTFWQELEKGSVGYARDFSTQESLTETYRQERKCNKDIVFTTKMFKFEKIVQNFKN